MTRINTVNPSDLTDEWLLAEWRELPRIVNELEKYPTRLKVKDIPLNYTLNKGHVKFFRNKLLYLAKRHREIKRELRVRGIRHNKNVKVELYYLAPWIRVFACNDWKPSVLDHETLIERLDERFNLRKKSYNITCNNIKSIINCSSSYKDYKTKYLNKYL